MLIAGKGDRQFQIEGSHRQFFDDCEIARQWLQDVGAQIEYEEELAQRVIPFTLAAHSMN